MMVVSHAMLRKQIMAVVPREIPLAEGVHVGARTSAETRVEAFSLPNGHGSNRKTIFSPSINEILMMK